MKTFTFKWYRQDDAGNIYRVTETIAESRHTEYGYIPQQVVSVTESEVRTVDADYPDAVDYLQETNRPY